MNLTAEQKRLIVRILNVFETGRPDGDYAAIAVFHDGPHDIRQITYGRSQTTEYGNLRELVQDYVAADGMFSHQLAAFADDVGSVPLTDNSEFRRLLRDAGRHDPVMRQVQDAFFDRRYFDPAMRWADRNGFTEPLSGLVIYDSFIHSGSILWLLRVRFAESPPSGGGNERVWTSEYVNARNHWLANHHRSAVRNTTYRTACFQREIARGNWDLTQVPVHTNGVDVDPGGMV